MEPRAKERLIGAAVLISLAVIFLPMLMGPPRSVEREASALSVPPPPEAFHPRIAPVEERRMNGPDEHYAGRPGMSRIEGTASSGSVPSAQEAGPTGSKSRARRLVADAAPPSVVGEAHDANVAETPPSVDAGAWVVQLASFSDAGNAEALRDRLRARGYSAFIRSVYGEPGTVTRVYVGPELERDRARESVEALERDTKLRGIVVHYP